MRKTVSLTSWGRRLNLEYDFYYIKHFSYWLDVIIVIKTLHAVLSCFGSRCRADLPSCDRVSRQASTGGCSAR
jgi:hypothetical protein